MLKIGIAGIGFMGMIHYLAAQKVKGARVTAIASRDPKKLAGNWRGIQGNFGPPGAQMDLRGVKCFAEFDELIADPTTNTESIAKREDCTARKVNMTISLAFLAPDLVKAAIDGRLPHGMGVARLCDLPVEWSRQRQMLGLIAQ